MQTSAVHIVERMAPGGIESLVLDLMEDDSAAAVFSLQGSVTELSAAWPRLADVGASLETFGKKPGFNPSLTVQLARALRRRSPRAVFLHHMGPLVYGGFAARIARVPQLFYVEHDSWHYEKQRDRQILRAVECLVRPQLIAVARSVADEVELIVGKRSVTVIPPGVELDKFRPADRDSARLELGLPAHWKIVGFAGRLVAVKGLDLAIQAIARLDADTHLVIVGDGPERARLQALSIAEGVESRVHFLGHRENLAAIYPAFDVFCLTSHAEGLPRSLLEAQACSVPVVSTNAGGIAEAICSQSGQIVADRCPDRLAAALQDVLRRSPQKDPRPHMQESLSWQHTAAKFRALVGAA